jgi:hypothetical protein
MSWAKVFKINSDLKKPLNTLISELISALSTKVTSVDTKVGNVSTQVSNVSTQVGNVNTAVGAVNTKLTQMNTQIRDSRFLPMRIITSTTTFKPEKSGLYKIICVGAGGNGDYDGSKTVASGGGGGVAIKTLSLSKSSTYNVTVGTTASFSDGTNSITATAGGSADAGDREGWDGGTASGGDYNFTGTSGDYEYNESGICPTPGSTGVFLSELSESKATNLTIMNTTFIVPYGNSILGYGGSGNAVYYYASSSSYSAAKTNGMPAAVIIIPLELEG